ncbi:YqiA/YcfP family alpha/beta fold hydrolase [Propionivibrio limicola]|uniref:YqiA/YcfP family alpha/beta fold hydrolase n=1 Tax=Propionivibrio limicola TaxID=167645 RepID=UPI001290F8EA|nr:YqiA/YcfP family alpha/beta fold hydrolase [Propionivibrio limicola]
MSANILYLHGFRSSPASWKSILLAETLRARGRDGHYFCPALSYVPFEAIAHAEIIIKRLKGDVALVGSSLGGYYATYLAEKYNLKAVLINPAVKAPSLLTNWVGTQINLHTRENFEFTYEHIEQLKRLDVATITPERYLVLLETGDQIVDYRDAVARYAGSRQIVVQGGEHLFLSFPEYVPQVLEFCGM